MDFNIGDTHFGHANIIRYENRPFADEEEMNSILMKNWNEKITPHDRVFHHGDVCFKWNKERTASFIMRLNGRKILIMGNHDRSHSVSWWRDVGFDEVYPYPIIVDGFYIFSHEPLYVGKEMPYVNIHGHTHGESSDNPQKVNVSAEVINYIPISFESIKARFA